MKCTHLIRLWMPVLFLRALGAWGGQVEQDEIELISENHIYDNNHPKTLKLVKHAIQLEKNWKRRSVLERLNRRGPAGQQPLFMEFVKLLTLYPDARKDENLIAILEWLLFSNGLAVDPVFSDPVHRRVAVHVPPLRKKILSAFLSPWLEHIGLRANGHEPWLQPGFHHLDRVHFRNHLEGLLDAEGKNPVRQYWIRVAVAAATGDPDGRHLKSAGAHLQREAPDQAYSVRLAAAKSLSETGLCAALFELLELAKVTPAADIERERNRRPSPKKSAPFPDAFSLLRRLCQLLSWTWKAPGEDAERLALIEAIREKLIQQRGRLHWNAGKRRFEGVARPTRVDHRKGVKSVAEKYGLEAKGDPLGNRNDARRFFSEILDLLKRERRATTDDQIKQVILALLKPGALEDDRYFGPRLYLHLPRYNREWGIEVWALRLKRELFEVPRHMPWPIPKALAQRKPDVKLILEAVTRIKPDVEAALAESAEKNSARRAWFALFRQFSDPARSFKDLHNELKKFVRTSHRAQQCRLMLWGEALVRFGNRAGLDLILYSIEWDERGQHKLAEFDYLAGRSASRRSRVTLRGFNALKKAVAERRTWLAKRGAELVWNHETGRFEDQARVAELAKKAASKPPRRKKKKPKPKKSRPEPIPPPVDEDF